MKRLITRINHPEPALRNGNIYRAAGMSHHTFRSALYGKGADLDTFSRIFAAVGALRKDFAFSLRTDDCAQISERETDGGDLPITAASVSLLSLPPETATDANADRTNASFAEAYSGMSLWRQFPVRFFCGETTLDDAITAQVNTRRTEGGRSEQNSAPPKAGLDMVTAKLDDIRQSGQPLPAITSLVAAIEHESLEQGAAQLLLLGEAGDGKSTALRMLGSHYCKEGLFPVLIGIRQWEDSKLSLREFVRHEYFKPEEDEILERSGDLLWEKVMSGDAPLLLDGLDEAQDPHNIGTRLMKVQEGIRLELTRRKISVAPIVVVTSRRLGYRNALQNFRTIEIQPFDFGTELITYVQKRLGENAPEFLARLKDDQRIQALITSGLMLAMLCTIWEERRGQFHLLTFDLPVSRAELYEKTTELLLFKAPEKIGRREHTEFFGRKKELKRALLAAIAFHAQFCQGRTLFIPAGLVQKAIQEVTAPGTAFEADREIRNEVLEDIILNSEMLSCDSNGDLYRFFHPTFQEYFAAIYLVDHWDAPLWKDWLPTRIGWHEAGCIDLPWYTEFDKERYADDFVEEFRCPLCNNLFPPFSQLLQRTAYRETFLMMAGLLASADKEAILLHGISEALPPIPGYESESYRDGALFGVHLNTDLPPELNLAENAFFYLWYCYGDPQDPHAIPLLHLKSLHADIRGWLNLALQVISRCSETHPFALKRSIFGLFACATSSSFYENEWRMLGRARHPQNAAVCVQLFTTLMRNKDQIEAALGGDIETAEGIRVTLAKAIALMGGQEAENFLMAVVQDTQESLPLRKVVATYLLEHGDRSLAPQLSAIFVEAMDARHEDEFRRQTAEQLQQIGDETAIHALMALLQDKENSPALRADAAARLMQLNSHQFSPLFIEVARDGDNAPNLRRIAVMGMAHLLGGAQLTEDQRIQIFQTLEMLFVSGPEDMQLLIMGVLGLNKEGIHPLLEKVLIDKTHAARVRREAVFSLGLAGKQAALPTLQACYAEEADDSSLREIIHLATEAILSGEAEGVLFEALALNNDQAKVLDAANRKFLERMLLERMLDLIEMISQPELDDSQRSAALAALEKEYGKKTVELEEQGILITLSAELKNYENSESLRQDIARMLIRIAAGAMEAAFVELFLDKRCPSNLRRTLAWGLGCINTPSAVRALSGELMSAANLSNDALRITIIQALSKTDDTVVREELEMIADTQNEPEEIRLASIQALLDIRERKRAE